MYDGRCSTCGSYSCGCNLSSKIDMLTLELAKTLAAPTPRLELDELECDCDGHPNCICEIAADWQRIEAQR